MEMMNHVTDTETADSRWKGLYKVGGRLGLTFVDMVPDCPKAVPARAPQFVGLGLIVIIINANIWWRLLER